MGAKTPVLHVTEFAQNEKTTVNNGKQFA